MERNKNFDAGCYRVKTKAVIGDIATIVFWAVVMCMCASHLTGCGSTGGGRVCIGFEEQNTMKNTTGYEVPEKYKK